MGFTFDPVEMTVRVCSAGMKISDVTKQNIDWIQGTLCISDMGMMKSYNVFIGHKDGDTYLKVNDKYEDALFEQIFGFGCKCSGWNPYKTIKIA